MKNLPDQLLYFFLGIDKKRRSRKDKLKCRPSTEISFVVPGEAFDILPHIDFVHER